MEKSIVDVLVLVAVVLVSLIGLVNKARKKAVEQSKANETEADTQATTIPIPDPWQDLYTHSHEVEDDDFIPKNPRPAIPTPTPTSPKKEKQPLLQRSIEHEPRNYIEEMAQAKAIEREKKYSDSKYKNKLSSKFGKADLVDEVEDSGLSLIDLGLDEEDAWKKAVIYHDLLEPKF